MAIQITREEYEKRFGVAPVGPVRSVLEDEKPAPIRVTRAEYEAMFPSEYSYNRPVRNVVEGKAAFPAELGGAETILPNVARTAGNLPGATLNLARAAVAPVNPFDRENPLNIGQNLYESGAALKDIYGNRGAVEGTKDIVRGVGSTISKGYDLWKKAGEVIYENLKKNTISEDSVTKGVGLSAGEAMSKVAEAIINDPTLVPSLLYAPGKVRGTGVTDDAISAAARPVIDTTKKAAAPIVKKLDERRVNNVVKEIAKIEDKNAPTRKANVYSKDVQASRQRIAESNVLDGSVDTDGVIRTKVPGGAVDQYRLQSIDGKEDMVRKALVEFNETVPVATVRQALVREVGTSGLEGADLVTALKKIDKEIEGINVRIKGNTDVELWRLQDNKIATTKTINWQTPPEKTTYRKAVARAYKKLVEDNSKKFDVKPVNKELAKYLEDIKRLERLDGLRAEGGRLGKYTASMAGTLIGGAAGSVGGGIGSAVGGIIGGEGAAALKGLGMSRTFKGGGKGLPKNPVLEKARLSIPDKAIKAKVGVPKTKAIIKTEKDIAKNVEAQKKAIKAGDFTLVATLKEVYETLVAKLKELIKEAVEAQKNPRIGQRGSVDFFAPLPKKGGGIFGDITRTTPSEMAANLTKEDIPMANKALTKAWEDIPSDELADFKQKFKLGGVDEGIGKKFLREALDEYDERWDGVEDALGREGKMDIQKPTTLLEEAKGKTLDEFLKAQPAIYHGTPYKFDKFDPEKTPGGSAWFSDNLDAVKNNRVEGSRPAGSQWNVMERYIKPDVKLVDRSTPEGKRMADNLYSEQLESMGYKGIKHEADAERGSYIELFKPNEDTLTRTQLEDIWKQANGKTGSTALLEEAKKFDNGADFYNYSTVQIRDEMQKLGVRGKEQFENWYNANVKTGTKSYAMSHRPTQTGATADNITQEVSDMGFPKDFYDNPQFYAQMSDKASKESLDALMKVRGNPDATVTIYRASPKNEINEGDWVTLSKEYAKRESMAENTPVHSFKVKAKDIQFAGDDINEFGYWPTQTNGKTGSSTLLEEAKKYKSAEELTPNSGQTVSTTLANFIGKNAKTFNTEASFQALDGMVRNQINASLKMKPLFDDIVENRATGNKSWAQFVPLRELVDYPELFTAYPSAKNIRVSFMDMDKNDFGSFYLDDRGVPTINLNRSKKDATQTLKHEIQHFIQAKEGFSLGGNPDVLFRADVQNQVLKQQLRNVIRDKEIYQNATIGDMEYIKSAIEKTGRGEKLTAKEIEDFFGDEKEFNDLAMKTYKHLHGEWEAEANSMEELLKVKSPIFGKSKK